ncbi:MAG: hypothetical protein IT553_08575 [Sphingomonadaceae bacterium]|nr:hypothetical protein [Sphingomonadaceae bacterium]
MRKIGNFLTIALVAIGLASPAMAACPPGDRGMKVLIVGGQATKFYHPDQILCSGTRVELFDDDLIVLLGPHGRRWIEGPRTFNIGTVQQEQGIGFVALARIFWASFWAKSDDEIAVVGAPRLYAD